MARDRMEPNAFIRKQLEEAEPDLLRELLHDVVDRIMGAEVDALAGAAHGERTPGRTNRRNGYRERRWDTRLGTIDLRIPKLRKDSYFPDWLLQPRRRSERALTAVIAEAYVLGVSTRRVEELVRTLGIEGISKSQVSELARSLDADVEAFRSRPLDGAPYRHVQADALALRVREGGRVVHAAALVATGVNADGHREVLGLEVVTAEDGAAWTAFWRGLVARGLTGVELVTSDAHAGLREAIAAVLPGAAWQRCRTHFARNLLAKVPRSAQPFVATFIAHDLRPAGRHVHLAAAALRRRRAAQTLPGGGRAARGRCAGPARVHPLPTRPLAPDLVDQSAGASQPRAAPAHRRRRDLSQSRCHHPPGRRGARRAARRVAGGAPLHGPRVLEDAADGRCRSGGDARARGGGLIYASDEDRMVVLIHHARGLGPLLTRLGTAQV